MEAEAAASGHGRAALAAAAVGVQVGMAAVATRFVTHDLPPATLAFLRYAIGIACLIPPLALVWRRRLWPPIARADFGPIALLGVGQFALLIALFNYGLQTVTAARGTLIFSMMPLITLVFAALVGREHLDAAKVIAVVLTIAGVGFAVGEAAWRHSAEAHRWTGETSVFGAACVGAVCSVLYRPYLRRYPTLPVSAIAMFAAVVALALPALIEGGLSDAADLGAAAWSAVVFIGLSSGIGYYLWLWALGHTTPTRVTIFLSLSPVTAALLGALFLGEPVSPGVVLGCIAIAAGLWLAYRAPRHQASSDEREAG